MAIKSFEDLEVYKSSFKLAMQIFEITIKFPKEEIYSLTDQIRRSSRSISINIAEGWGKRHYEHFFKKHLIDALGSVDETKGWLSFSVECKYLGEDKYNELYEKYQALGAKIYKLHENWNNNKK